MRFLLLFCLSLVANAASVLRVVEATLPIELSPSLQTNRIDLITDGWDVETVYVPAQEVRPPYALHQQIARNTVWPWLRSHLGGHVLLIGNVPVPKTGLYYGLNEIKSDWGAMRCAGYYVLPDVAWTDVGNNSGYSPNNNLPGDGWFDQEYLGDSVPLGAVGWINFSNENPKTWASPLKTVDFRTQLMREYLKKVHDYRTGKFQIRTTGGQGDYRATNAAPTSYFRAWTEAQYSSHYGFFGPKDSNAKIWASAPYGVFWDFKRLDVAPVSWMLYPKEWALLGLSFGSGQCNPESQRIRSEFIWGALTAASHCRQWDLQVLSEGGTVGQAWMKTLISSRDGLFLTVHGDVTLRMNRKD